MKINYSRIRLVLAAFLAALLLFGCASAPQVKPFKVNAVQVRKGSPEKSFWRDQVTYPFNVKYAKAKDSRGMEWEIAYMDEYYGIDPQPKVLVLIHGKGAFGAYFGHVMKVALQNGLRVIVPDLPHFGKSIPGNLHKPLSRSLQDTREAIHDLIVQQLGVKQAAYLGHSLGGQWVLGYALTYPGAVEKIILESSAGLEEYPTKIKIGDKEMLLFDDSQKDMKSWEVVWGDRLKQGLMQDDEYWINFAYFKHKNPKTGKIEPSRIGFFINDTEYAKFFTEVRIALNHSNKREHYNYVAEDARDIYSLGIESRREDPNSIYKRIRNIKAPIFLTFGEKDPLLPTLLSGKTDLKWEIIKPVYDDLKKAGNPPLVKIYAGAGHFIHTDFPDLYSNDVVNFVLKSKAGEPLEDVEGYKSPNLQLPEDVQAFLNQFRDDVLSRDMKKISMHYAASFKQDGYNRQAFLELLSRTVGFIAKYETKMTKLEADKTDPAILHVDGSVDLGSLTAPFADRSMMIKENGVWKWYGNQK
ncbi:MAG: alpha/beta hydrolase [Deltaproteobacteria bacterium HGW-Deltaproteobacteria-12]|jgi:pimeloyl-ACP methyl ester carboxylesterase|nr:MAG: alpha/beta hydrolase [Deltaproteobacteria bacterium HGW-Deltaproteobacteria-12]